MDDEGANDPGNGGPAFCGGINVRPGMGQVAFRELSKTQRGHASNEGLLACASGMLLSGALIEVRRDGMDRSVGVLWVDGYRPKRSLLKRY
ncbi:hypothetical protein D3C85_1166280 [compost metagenome]